MRTKPEVKHTPSLPIKATMHTGNDYKVRMHVYCNGLETVTFVTDDSGFARGRAAEVVRAVNSHGALLEAAEQMRDSWTDNDNTTAEEYAAYEKLSDSIAQAKKEGGYL